MIGRYHRLWANIGQTLGECMRIFVEKHEQVFDGLGYSQGGNSHMRNSHNFFYKSHI